MPLQISQIKAAYACTQDEVYAACLLIVDSYLENQPLFLTKKTTYTVALGTALRNEILAAKALPDQQQRGAIPEGFKVQLTDAADAGLIIWQELESLINSSFPANLQKTKREEAGSTHYAKAGRHNWESVSQLLLSGSTFITTYTAELTTGGMVAGFPVDYENKRGDFNLLYGQFKGAEQTTQQQRETKITANNTFYEKIVALNKDGKKYYRNNPGIRERFTFSKVLELVSGSGTETITIPIAANTSVTTDKVVANSPIINTGAVSILVCSGSAACDPLTARLLNPNDQVTNSFGPVVTITNNNAQAGKASLRVVQP
jgi:hypothetical protein